MKSNRLKLLLILCIVGSIGYLRGQTSVADENAFVTAIGTIPENGTGTIIVTSSFDVTQEIEISNKKLIIEGEGNPLLKVHNAENFRMFNISSGSLTLKNIDLEGGTLTDQQDQGGAIYAHNGAKLRLENVTIQNSSAAYGGGIYTEGDIEIISSTFKGNQYSFTTMDGSEYKGGALYAGGNITISGETSFEDNHIEKTEYQSKDEAFGGAIYCQGNLTIHEGAHFERNSIYRTDDQVSGSVYGGAIYVAGDLTINGSSNNKVTFKNNVAESGGAHIAYGGAIYTIGKTVISHTDFIGNIANKEPNNPSGHGGAIYTKGILIIDNSTFENNFAFAIGGAIFSNGNETQITSTSFHKNEAGGWGGAYFSFGGSVTIKDCYFGEENNPDDYSNSAGRGGAICLNNTENPVLTIEGSYFYKNKSLDEGGTIYMYSNVPNSEMRLNIKDSHFEGNFSNKLDLEPDNSMSSAGTIFMYGATDDDQDIKATLNVEGNCTFKDNKSHIGAAVRLRSKTVEANIGVQPGSDITFTGNQALAGMRTDFFSGEGGAIAIYSHLPSAIQIGSANSKVSFTENKAHKGTYAHGRGGAFIFFGNRDTDITFTNVSLNNNEAIEGGAIYTSGKELIINDCTFDKNTGIENGGAIYSEYSAVTVKGKTLFSNNYGGWDGGAILLKGWQPLIIEGKEVTSNEPTFDDWSIKFIDNRVGNRNGGSVYINGGGALGTSSISNVLFTSQDPAITHGSGGGNGAGIFTASHDLTLNNVFIEKLKFSDSGSWGYGGAIRVEGGSLTMKKGELRNNHALKAGGGISVSGGGKIMLTDVIISNNTVTQQDGGGIAGTDDAVIELQDVIFKDNDAYSGGGMYINNGSTATINGGKFVGNKARGWGGAICDVNSKLILNKVSFFENITSISGTIHNSGSEAMFTHVIMMENIVNGNNGGGIDNQKSQLTLLNCLLAKNTAKGYGGGIYNSGTDSKATLINCTISENEAAYGGGLMTYENGVAITYNSIIWKNTATYPNIYGGKYEYCLIEGQNIGGTNFDGTLNPRFAYSVEPTMTGPLRYGLLPGSAAIDKGENNYFLPYFETHTKYDLADNDRIYNLENNGKIDLGVYEYPTLPTVEFIEDNTICDGSNAALKVRLTGTAPWHITYQVVGSSPLIERKTTITATDDDGFAMIDDMPLSEDVDITEYLLVAVSQGDTDSEVNGLVINQTTAKINVVGNPSVAAISGPSEVYVGENIKLSNLTPDGYWYSEDEAYATVDQTGRVTGILAGTVDIWYAVIGAAPTNCETIKTHTITIKTKGTEEPDPEDPDPVDPDPDPDPWPPVVPEPDPDPDPNPNAWIIVRPIAPLCYTDEFFNVAFDLLYKDKPLLYAVAFTDASKAAGFEDVKTYKELPKDNVVSIAIPKGIKPGTYNGYIVLREKGSQDLDMYPFRIVIRDGVKITRQPESVTGQNSGGTFTLSVEAEGDNLKYQWFHNGQKVEGATSKEYKAAMDADHEGIYYAEVYGDCGWDQSEEATISSCFTVLLKWKDVMYVQNLDGRYDRFQWYKDGQAITTYGASIYYTDPDGLFGSYFVRAYKKDGSYDQSCSLQFDTPTRASSVSVYPTVIHQNNNINIESDEMGESYLGALVEIFSITGQKVYSRHMNSVKLELPMNQPTGVYILHITPESGRKSIEKIIVK